MIDAAGGCLRLYGVKNFGYGARDLADVILLSSEQILLATQKM